MTTLSLTRAETGILQAAADQGYLHFTPMVKPASCRRHVARFLRDGLIDPLDGADGQHRLTPAGYRAIGLTPPTVPGTAPGPNKKALVLTLLARDEGATLAELITATGWLPHTTRAALSRIRTGGQPLAKAARPDAAIAYRILPPAPTARTRARRKGEPPTLVANGGMGAEPQVNVLTRVTA